MRRPPVPVDLICQSAMRHARHAPPATEGDIKFAPSKGGGLALVATVTVTVTATANASIDPSESTVALPPNPSYLGTLGDTKRRQHNATHTGDKSHHPIN